MVAWNMSEAHKVVDLLRHAPKDDIIVMLLCMSLTVLFDMVIAISVGIVLASLLFMRRIARMTRPAPVVVDVPDDVWFCALLARCFAAAEGYSFTDPESRLEGKRIVILKWDAVPVLDAGGLDAFQRFVKRLPEGCELRVCNVEFQPLRTMARAGIQPIPGRLGVLPESSRGDGGFISTRLTSQRKLTGQQTALFVSYDGDYRYGGNVCHSGEPTSNGRTPVHARQHGHPPAREWHRRKYFSTAPCAKYWGILNCGNWLRIEYPTPTTITTRPNPMSTLPSNEAFLRFICHLRNFLGCKGNTLFLMCKV